MWFFYCCLFVEFLCPHVNHPSFFSFFFFPLRRIYTIKEVPDTISIHVPMFCELQVSSC